MGKGDRGSGGRGAAGTATTHYVGRIRTRPLAPSPRELSAKLTEGVFSPAGYERNSLRRGYRRATSLNEGGKGCLLPCRSPLQEATATCPLLPLRRHPPHRGGQKPSPMGKGDRASGGRGAAGTATTHYVRRIRKRPLAPSPRELSAKLTEGVFLTVHSVRNSLRRG